MPITSNQRMGNATLTPKDVRYIKDELGKGVAPRVLAELFHVGTETIRRIGRGESWNWVESTPQPPSEEVINASLNKLLQENKDA